MKFKIGHLIFAFRPEEYQEVTISASKVTIKGPDGMIKEMELNHRAPLMVWKKGAYHSVTLPYTYKNLKVRDEDPETYLEKVSPQIGGIRSTMLLTSEVEESRVPPLKFTTLHHKNDSYKLPDEKDVQSFLSTLDNPKKICPNCMINFGLFQCHFCEVSICSMTCLEINSPYHLMTCLQSRMDGEERFGEFIFKSKEKPIYSFDPVIKQYERQANRFLSIDGPYKDLELQLKVNAMLKKLKLSEKDRNLVSRELYANSEIDPKDLEADILSLIAKEDTLRFGQNKTRKNKVAVHLKKDLPQAEDKKPQVNNNVAQLMQMERLDRSPGEHLRHSNNKMIEEEIFRDLLFRDDELSQSTIHSFQNSQ